VRGGFGPSDEAAVLVRIPSIAGNRPGEYTVARGALAQPVVERLAGDAHTIEETTFTIEASWSEGKEKTVRSPGRGLSVARRIAHELQADSR